VSNGKQLRLRRIFSEQGRSLIVPMDHGVSIGAVDGLRDAAHAASLVSAGGADAVVVHKGLVAPVAARLRPSTALIVHLSASTNLGPHPDRKVAVCTVPEAVRLGADAVSIHINAGTATEPEQIIDAARIAGETDLWGVPLLAMVYVRSSPVDEFDPAKVGHAVRMAAELGADLVKCHYTGDPESFRQVVEGCPVPVLIAGGAAHGDVRRLLTTVHEALAAGAAGISMGRNVFEAADPVSLTRRLAELVHGGRSVDEVYDAYLAQPSPDGVLAAAAT
jgi:fructose-bisphosphate aldolase, class I